MPRIPLEVPDAMVALIDPARIPAKPGVMMPLSLNCPACACHVVSDWNQPGEVVLCVGCRALLVLGVNFRLVYIEDEDAYGWMCLPGDIALRYPTDEEEKVALSDPNVLRAIALVAEHHAQHGSPHPDISPPDDFRRDPWSDPR